MKISTWQFLCIIIAAMNAFGHFVYVHLALIYAGRDAWLSLIISCVISFSIIFVYIKIIPSQSEKSWLAITDPIAKRIPMILLVSLYILFFFLISAITLRILVDFLSMIYPYTPQEVFFLCLFLLMTWLLRAGLEVITRLIQIVVPFLIIAGIFASIVSMREKEWIALLPMFDHGLIPIGQAVLIDLCMLSELIVFTIYAKKLSAPQQVKRFAWLFPPLVLLLFIAPTTGPVMLFGEYLAKRLDFPTYAELQYIQVGNVFPRLDVLGILLWTFGAFFRATLYSQGILLLLRENLATDQFKKFATLIAAIVVLMANLIAQERANLLSFLQTTYPIIAIVMGIGIPAIYLTITTLRRLRIKKKE